MKFKEYLIKLITEELDKSKNSSVIDYNINFILNRDWPDGGSIAYDFFMGMKILI